jgi:hypothetical protein
MVKNSGKKIGRNSDGEMSKSEGQTASEREYIKDMNLPLNRFDIVQMLVSIPISILIFMLQAYTMFNVPQWWVSILIILSTLFLIYLLIVKVNKKNVAIHVTFCLIFGITISIIFGLLFYGINWTTGEVIFTPVEFNIIVFTVIPASTGALGLDIFGK